MAKINLTPRAFEALKLLTKEGVNTGSLVSELIVAYAEMPPNKREALVPEFACSDCTHKYFSKESLEWHQKKTHVKQAQA